MPRALSERHPFLLLILLLIFNLLLMSSDVRGAGSGSVLEETIMMISAPFLKSADWVVRGLVDVWHRYADLRAVEGENQRLSEKIDTLAPLARQAEELRLEVERLQELLDLRGRVELPSLGAQVIARGAAGAPRILLLDRGTGDGVKVMQSVLTPRGIVGRIIEAAPGVSKVQTLLDPNSGVAALVQRTRDQGVVVGDGTEFCRMEFVNALSTLEVGDIVVTSGLDQIYPKGYIIGIVSAVGEGQGLTRMVQVRPEVDFMRLEEVLVLMSPDDESRREMM